MSTSNVRKLAEQKRRQAREEQRMAWARGDQRDRLAVASLATAARIAEMEGRR